MRLKGLNPGQRIGVVRALFDRIFKRKQNKIQIDGFKVKHGRGEEVNHDIAMNTS